MTSAYPNYLSGTGIGCLRSSNPLRNRKALMAVLAGVDILFFDNVAATESARIKDALLRAGTPIEDMDILIGAHARACNFTLVTDNEKHMKRIEGLRIEDWVERK